MCKVGYEIRGARLIAWKHLTIKDDKDHFHIVGDTVKRVNIILKDEVHTKAKLVSILKGTTLNSYIEEAIIDALSREKDLLEKLKKQL